MENKDLCIICCTYFDRNSTSSVSVSSPGRDKGQGQDDDNYFERFLKNLFPTFNTSSSSPSSRSGKKKIGPRSKTRKLMKPEVEGEDSLLSAVIELETAGELITCPNCQTVMKEVAVKSDRVEDVEKQIRKLQVEVVNLMKVLQRQLGDVNLEMKRFEGIVKDSDVSCLEKYFTGKETMREETKASIVEFRNRILTASGELTGFESTLKRKLLISDPKMPALTVRKKPASKAMGDPEHPPSSPLDPSALVKVETIDDDNMGMDEEDENYGNIEDYVSSDDDGCADPLGGVDSDYIPSDIDEQDVKIEQHFLSELVEGKLITDDDPETTNPHPPRSKKKWKKKKKKNRETQRQKIREYTAKVIGMGEFRSNVIKQILKTQARKYRMDTQKRGSVPDDTVEDPSQNYAVEYDFASRRIHVRGVEILLNEEMGSLTCSICYHVAQLSAKRPNDVLSSMFIHILGKHLEAFKCRLCQTVFQTRSRYKEHQRAHQLHFVCDTCGKSVSSNNALFQHKWRLHMSEEERQQALANGVKDPLRHMVKCKEKQKLNPLQCSECPKTFLTAATLKSHQETHLDIEQREKIICNKCGKSFLKSSYISHQQNTCTPDGAPLLYCDQCPEDALKPFKSKHLLKRHVDRCHGKGLERAFRCHLCSKGYKSHNDLLRHIRTHSNERPYICQYGCGADFKTRKDVKRHENNCKGDPSKWKGPRQKKASTADVDMSQSQFIIKQESNPKPSSSLSSPGKMQLPNVFYMTNP